MPTTPRGSGIPAATTLRTRASTHRSKDAAPTATAPRPSLIPSAKITSAPPAPIASGTPPHSKAPTSLLRYNPQCSRPRPAAHAPCPSARSNPMQPSVQPPCFAQALTPPRPVSDLRQHPGRTPVIGRVGPEPDAAARSGAPAHSLSAAPAAENTGTSRPARQARRC